MLEAELTHEEREHEEADDDHVAHVLVVHERVHEQGHDAKQDVVDPAQAEQRLQVEPELELEVALERLGCDPREHDDRQQDGDGQRKRRELRHEGYPRPHGHRVVHLVCLEISLLPNELTRVKGDEHEDEEREAPLQHLQRRVGDGEGRCPIQLADQRGTEAEEEQACSHDCVEVHVARDRDERLARHRCELEDDRHSGERACGRGNFDTVASGPRRRIHERGDGFSASRQRRPQMRESKDLVTESEDRGPDRQPEQPVVQKCPTHRRQQ